MSFRAHRFLTLTALFVATAAVAGERSLRDSSALRLQPFADLEAGGYVDAENLASAPPPRAGTLRARQWDDARRHGLEALIVRPDVVRGAYRDVGAVHSAWGDPAAR